MLPDLKRDNLLRYDSFKLAISALALSLESGSLAAFLYS